MQFARTITVHLRAPAATRDVYGDEVVGDTTSAEWPAEYQQLSTTEQVIDRDVTRSVWLVLLPPAADVNSVAQVTIDGHRCEIVGAPELVYHPWTRAVDHWEMTARRTEG